MFRKLIGFVFLTQIFIFTGFLIVNNPAGAQYLNPEFKTSYLLPENTIGLIHKKEGALSGYTLFAPKNSTTTYLIDLDGLVVNMWESDTAPRMSVYLLENGNLLRACETHSTNQAFEGGGGRILELEWNGYPAWDYIYSSSDYQQHHDIERLPNGNTLIIAWELKTKEEAVEEGRNPSLIPAGESSAPDVLWPDKIVEVKPAGPATGEVVWEWRAWDHLIQDYDSTKANYGIVRDNPGKINLNYVKRVNADWLHFNSVDYNEELDQIVISCRAFDELWVIDHSTADYKNPAAGIEAAAGPAGDLMYRWGNPQTYDRGTGADKKLFGQHDVRWIGTGSPGEGNFLIYNNGQNRPDGKYSSVDEIVPPVDENGMYYLAPDSAFGPPGQSWIYTADNKTDFYSTNISGAQRLPNGNTLICKGSSGNIFEITPENEMVWQYINPVNADGPQQQGTAIKRNQVFRANRYFPGYPGFDGKRLTPKLPIELPNINFPNVARFAGVYEITMFYTSITFNINLTGINVAANGTVITISTPETGSGTITVDGALFFTIGQAVFSGTISENFEISGTFSDTTASGTFTGYKVITEVSETEIKPPVEFELFQNYPNPFNPETTIYFQLPKTSYVSVKIYDILGKEVKNLLEKNLPAGRHHVIWDGKNNSGTNVNSGVFIYQMKVGNFVSFRKMVLSK